MGHLATNRPGDARMLDVLRDGLRRHDRMSLSVSFLRFSGLQLLLNDLEQFHERGGTARILTSTYLGVTQPEALEILASVPGVELRVQLAQAPRAPAFHPKFVVFEGESRECWVGSSNLSKGGLTSNVEANLRHDDPQVVDEVVAAFDKLWSSDSVFPMSRLLGDAYANALLTQPNLTARPLNLALDGLIEPDPKELAKPNEAQREALRSLATLRGRGEKRAVVIGAPGIGKTFLAAFDVEQAGATSALFVSHRLEHLAQARDTFARIFRDRFTLGMVHGGRIEAEADFVFATVQSASKTELLLERKFDYLVVDEFHHASAPSYRTLLDKVSPRFLLGLTATPERQDGHDVLKICDFNIAYEVRLIEAINRDWLVPFHYFGIADETVDWEASVWRSRRFDPEAMQNALMLEARVDHIVEHALNKGYDGLRRATVGFCAGVRHARFMANALAERGFVSECLTGQDDLQRRQRIYDSLEDPEHPLEWLFVADLLNEGVDIPSVNSILFLRPTDSATIFIQQLGRGLRLSPHCELLTVLDFVGHHRNAWLSLEALSDKAAPPGPSTLPDLDLTPPKNCEVILDDQTREILRKVRKQSMTKRDECVDAYRRLRDEIGPPFPVDLIGREDVPDLGQFRYAFGSWLRLREEMGDATHWERQLNEEAPAARLFAAAERNWQQPRVYAYALLWGLCLAPEEPADGYRQFFERFPRWLPEWEPLESTKAWTSLTKKLDDDLLTNGRLVQAIFDSVPRDELVTQIESRIRYTIEGDYIDRHGGVLRTPDKLTLHRTYGRPEIINHFGHQYDPALHNMGFLELEPPQSEETHIVLITKIDTSGAKEEFHYQNELVGERHFHWQSQNRQRRDVGSGERLVTHRERGVSVHLFAQPRSHHAPVYLGECDVEGVEGDEPMNVVLRLRDPVPASVQQLLGG